MTFASISLLKHFMVLLKVSVQDSDHSLVSRFLPFSRRHDQSFGRLPDAAGPFPSRSQISLHSTLALLVVVAFGIHYSLFTFPHQFHHSSELHSWSTDLLLINFWPLMRPFSGVGTYKNCRRRSSFFLAVSCSFLNPDPA